MSLRRAGLAAAVLLLSWGAWSGPALAAEPQACERAERGLDVGGGMVDKLVRSRQEGRALSDESVEKAREILGPLKACRGRKGRLALMKLAELAWATDDPARSLALLDELERRGPSEREGQHADALRFAVLEAALAPDSIPPRPVESQAQAAPQRAASSPSKLRRSTRSSRSTKSRTSRKSYRSRSGPQPPGGAKETSIDVRVGWGIRGLFASAVGLIPDPGDDAAEIEAAAPYPNLIVDAVDLVGGHPWRGGIHYGLVLQVSYVRLSVGGLLPVIFRGDTVRQSGLDVELSLLADFTAELAISFPWKVLRPWFGLRLAGSFLRARAYRSDGTSFPLEGRGGALGPTAGLDLRWSRSGGVYLSVYSYLGPWEASFGGHFGFYWAPSTSSF